MSGGGGGGRAWLSTLTLPIGMEYALLMGSLASTKYVFVVANQINKSQHLVAAFLLKSGRARQDFSGALNKKGTAAK